MTSDVAVFISRVVTPKGVVFKYNFRLLVYTLFYKINYMRVRASNFVKSIEPAKKKPRLTLSASI